MLYTDLRPVNGAEQGETLGDQVRAARLQRGLAASELARRAGVSRSLVSQIEHDVCRPSVDVLRRLADALGVQVGALFAGPAVDGRSAPDKSRARLVRSTERKVLGLPASHIRYELLSPDLQGALEFVRMEIAPGAVMPSVGWSHLGEECILVLEGTGRFHYGDEVLLVEAGDAVTFDSSVPHYLENATAAPLVAVSAGTPPSF
jgi:transcriptional regulator with XRE-family HTH domain